MVTIVEIIRSSVFIGTFYVVICAAELLILRLFAPSATGGFHQITSIIGSRVGRPLSPLTLTPAERQVLLEWTRRPKTA